MMTRPGPRKWCTSDAVYRVFFCRATTIAADAVPSAGSADASLPHPFFLSCFVSLFFSFAFLKLFLLRSHWLPLFGAVLIDDFTRNRVLVL